EDITPPLSRRRSWSWQGMPPYNETQDHLLSVVATTREDCTRFAAGCKRTFSGRQFEDFPQHFRGRDGTWIAWHPGRAHGLTRDAVEVLRPDIHRVQTARHGQSTDEPVQHVARILT